MEIDAAADGYGNLSSGATVAGVITGSPAEEAFIVEDRVWVIGPDGRAERFEEHLQTQTRSSEN